MAFNIFVAGTLAKASEVNENFAHINYGSPFLPTNSTGVFVDDTIDIGSLTQRFRDGYFSGQVRSEQPKARVRKSVNQDPGSTDYAISWDVEDYDTGNFHDNVTNNERLTMSEPGDYLVNLHLGWNVSDFGPAVRPVNFNMEWYNSGDVLQRTFNVSYGTVDSNYTTNNSTDINMCHIFGDVSSGDYVRIHIDRNNIDIRTLAADSFFQIYKLPSQ